MIKYVYHITIQDLTYEYIIHHNHIYMWHDMIWYDMITCCDWLICWASFKTWLWPWAVGPRGSSGPWHSKPEHLLGANAERYHKQHKFEEMMSFGGLDTKDLAWWEVNSNETFNALTYKLVLFVCVCLLLRDLHSSCPCLSFESGEASGNEDPKNYALQALTEALDRAEARPQRNKNIRARESELEDVEKLDNSKIPQFASESSESSESLIVFGLLMSGAGHLSVLRAKVEMLSGHQRCSEVSEVMQCGLETWLKDETKLIQIEKWLIYIDYSI